MEYPSLTMKMNVILQLCSYLQSFGNACKNDVYWKAEALKGLCSCGVAAAIGIVSQVFTDARSSHLWGVDIHCACLPVPLSTGSSIVHVKLGLLFLFLPSCWGGWVFPLSIAFFFFFFLVWLPFSVALRPRQAELNQFLFMSLRRTALQKWIGNRFIAEKELQLPDEILIQGRDKIAYLKTC